MFLLSIVFTCIRCCSNCDPVEISICCMWVYSHCSSLRAAPKVLITRRSHQSRWNQTSRPQEKKKREMTRNQSIRSTSSAHQSPRRPFLDQGCFHVHVLLSYSFCFLFCFLSSGVNMQVIEFWNQTATESQLKTKSLTLAYCYTLCITLSLLTGFPFGFL